MPRTLTLSQARRVAIAAQGLDKPRPSSVTIRHLTATLRRLGVVQIDSVNVLARAHLLPFFSRLGPYDTALVGRASGRAPRCMVETWAHEASYVPVETFPLLSWHRRSWNGMNVCRMNVEHPGLLEAVLAAVAAHGPMTARDLQDHVAQHHLVRPTDRWGWAWTPAKTALEILFDHGQVTPARRNAQFERVFDLTERVLGQHTEPLDRSDAVLELLRIAARAHGIGTVRCFADYFRLRQDEIRAAITMLEATGELVPVTVTGWAQPVWLHTSARVPRKTTASALLAPFDPLVFERRRVQTLFGMRYRLEIYTPAAQRVHGYYVLPFLLGEHLVARVDLKHDRQARLLRVAAAHVEPAVESTNWPSAGNVARALADELVTLARWLGAEDVVVADVGSLVPALRGALAT